jgi:lipoyl(octanoyl) transferase
LALNVKMDLEPFGRINPCGHVGLQSVDLFTMGVDASWEEVADVLGHKLHQLLAP